MPENTNEIRPYQSLNNFVNSGDDLKYKLAEVGINQGIDLDAWMFNELSLAKITEEERWIILEYFRALKLYESASTRNPKSGREYNLRQNMMSVYERMRTLAISSKAVDGWITKQILNPKITTEQVQSIKNIQAKEERGVFDSNNQMIGQNLRP